MSQNKFYIIKRSNLLDCDGSAIHDSFEILETFNELTDCTNKFKTLVADLDKENIIKKHTINKSLKSNPKYNNLTTLISEYRKIEIFKFWENECIALEIIRTDINPKKFDILDGVRDFMGCIYSV